MDRSPQDFDRVLSSMCTRPHPAARAATESFLASNPGDPATFPTVADLESEAVERLGEIVGLDAPAGYIASGGTEANIQAVRAARNRADVADPNVVVSASAHFSFDKAASLLDVELRRAALDGARRVDMEAMASLVDAQTVLLVGVAGSTEYGRVDPIPAIAELASSIDAHCHVDAAWGGFHLPFTDEAWHFGHASIDTMTIDPHKVGQAAIPAGGFLAREVSILDALAVETPYLETNHQPTLLGTRSGAGVASVVAALSELWPAGYREEYERAQDLADWLADRFAQRGLAVVPPTLPLVTVDIDDDLFDAVRNRGWRISRTTTGELRIVVMPHVTRETLTAFLADLDECIAMKPHHL